MKDFLGSELSVNDTVIYFDVRYRVFATGTIVKIGKKKLTIKETNGNRPWVENTFREPQCVIKKPI